MQNDTLTAAAHVPAALVAFLRGVERRASVFAQLQCGDPEIADAALAAAMRAFRDGAPAIPVGDWPQRFWTLLLAAPSLRRLASAPQWPLGLEGLSQLGGGSRAALLLRLVAGMQEPQAASVLGVPLDHYRAALARAAPRDADGAANSAAWQSLVEHTQQALRLLPPERLAHLARLREAALQPPRARHRPRTPITSARAPMSAHRRRSLWSAVVVSLLALAASFLLPSLLRPGDGDPRIVREALPPAEKPASDFDALTGVLSDPDFELLLDQGSPPGVAAPDDFGFLSWYAAQQTGAHANAIIDADASTAQPALQATQPQEGADAPP